MHALLIGSGNDRAKKLDPGSGHGWDQLTTLDISPACEPDMVWDLNVLPYPFEADSFDEIHAYCVLEHCGHQGDHRFFFAQWSEFWRILKPDGVFCGQTPSPLSPWAWGDPSHTRVVSLESLIFLDQQNYREKVGTTPMTDFREIYSADFVCCKSWRTEDHDYFVLRARKEPAHAAARRRASASPARV